MLVIDHLVKKVELGKVKSKMSIYMGIVIDTVYGEPSKEAVPEGLRFWARLVSNRVYSDEIPMATGVFAYNRMMMFKENFQSIQAQAWKELV